MQAGGRDGLGTSIHPSCGQASLGGHDLSETKTEWSRREACARRPVAACWKKMNAGRVVGASDARVTRRRRFELRVQARCQGPLSAPGSLDGQSFQTVRRFGLSTIADSCSTVVQSGPQDPSSDGTCASKLKSRWLRKGKHVRMLTRGSLFQGVETCVSHAHR